MLPSAYDNNGNTLTKTDSTGVTSYAWDFENRLSQITLQGSSGLVTFKYDPFGRRIQKSGPLGTTNYLYDGARMVAEMDNSGSITTRYVQGLLIDEPLSVLRSGSINYYQADGLGSITSLTDTSAAAAATYSYDAFGNLSASTGSLTNSFRFTAHEFDPETGLYYSRARYIDLSTGRFLSEDPARSGTTFYAYVGNKPTNRT